MSRRPPTPSAPVTAATLLALLCIAAAGPSRAASDRWSLDIEPVFVNVFGNDQHVLSIHQLDLSSPTAVDQTTGVNLVTNDEFAPRLSLQRAGDRWSFGMDFFLLATKNQQDQIRATGTGPASPAVFETVGREFTSSGPGETLFYGILEDTELAVWTLDLYALRKVVDTDNATLQLQVGLRNADFDNDYRAVVGVEGTGGVRLDASSNYGRMTGPLVGLLGEVSLGRNLLEGYVGQSVVFGEAELTNRMRDFVGPLDGAFAVEAEIAGTFADASFGLFDDVAIPITQVRLGWAYELTKTIALGVGVDASVWWDVPVPPGVVPGGSPQRLTENTIVLFGTSGRLAINF